jgi:hypothetical protein
MTSNGRREPGKTADSVKISYRTKPNEYTSTFGVQIFWVLRLEFERGEWVFRMILWLITKNWCWSLTQTQTQTQQFGLNSTDSTSV